MNSRYIHVHHSPSKHLRRKCRYGREARSRHLQVRKRNKSVNRRHKHDHYSRQRHSGRDRAGPEGGTNSHHLQGRKRNKVANSRHKHGHHSHPIHAGRDSAVPGGGPKSHRLQGRKRNKVANSRHKHGHHSHPIHTGRDSAGPGGGPKGPPPPGTTTNLSLKIVTSTAAAHPRKHRGETTPVREWGKEPPTPGTKAKERSTNTRHKQRPPSKHDKLE